MCLCSWRELVASLCGIAERRAAQQALALQVLIDWHVANSIRGRELGTEQFALFENRAVGCTD